VGEAPGERQRRPDHLLALPGRLVSVATRQGGRVLHGDPVEVLQRRTHHDPSTPCLDSTGDGRIPAAEERKRLRNGN
jgi:hypothetical protein